MLVFMVLLIISGGCASYTAKRMPAPQFSAMAVRYTEGDIRIGADPYLDADRQTAAFDVDLSKCGVLPIQLFVQNQGERALWVRPTEVKLDFADGTQISPIDVFTVGRCGKVGPGGEQASLITPPTQPMYGLGPQAGAAAGLFGVLIGVTSLAVAETGARDPRVVNYRENELRGALLRKNDSTHGFVFFYAPSDKQLSNSADLVVRFNDAADESSFTVRLLVSILKAGPPAAEKESATEAVQEPLED